MKIIQIKNPIEYFKNEKKFNETIEAIRDGFGSEMTKEDCYNHLISPDKLFLVEENNEIKGMASYSNINIGENILFAEGAAFKKEVQGKGLFKQITKLILNDERFIGLKTQNPRMYKALESMCSNISPRFGKDSLYYKKMRFGRSLNILTDEYGVSRGFYGTSLYSEIPQADKITMNLFEMLNIDYKKGDSLICLGKL